MWSVLSYASETDGPQPTLVSACFQPSVDRIKHIHNLLGVFVFLYFAFKFCQLTPRLPYHTFAYVIISLLLCLKPQLQIRCRCEKQQVATYIDNICTKWHEYFFLIKCEYHA